VQRWNPFKKKVKKNTDSDNGSIELSGPMGGRVMGEPKRQKAPILSMFEFEKDPRRRRMFVDWARKQVAFDQIGVQSKKAQFDNKKLSEEIVHMDLILSPFQSLTPPSNAEAAAMVKALRSCPDPEIQRVIAESEAKYQPFGDILRLEDAVKSEDQYRKKHGGIQMLAGISGVIHYMGNDLYTMFYGTPEYDVALGLPPVPPVPPRRPPVPYGDGPSQLVGTGARPDKVGKVSDLATRLEGKIGMGGPGMPPPRPQRPPRLHDAPVPVVPAAFKKVALEEREDPRATEREVLASIQSGGSVPSDLLDKLAAKMAKKQTTSRGREVTASTEAECAGIVSKLTPDEQRSFKQTANDYTQTSKQINMLARGQEPEANKQTVQINLDRLDAMFATLDKYGFTEKVGISYRLATYQAGQAIPFGSKINVGDFIADKAFVSTSQNRQFLQDGMVARKAGMRFVKLTYIASGGANISGAGPYNNETALRGKKELGLKGADTVGQAEILFRRNTVFLVNKIAVGKSGDVHVVVTKVDADVLAGQDPKNAFNGDPVKLG